MRIKYLVQYSGPSYSSWDQEYMDGETSLYAAMVSFRRRNVMGYDDVNTFRENPDGVHVAWELDKRVAFLGATDSDYMDVHYAIPENGGYVLGDWAYRLTFGPRKGVRAERA